MAVDKLQYSIGNAASSTLNSGMSNTDTTSSVTSTTNFKAKSGEGMVLIAEGASDEEIAYATAESGGTLTIPLANRGLEGGSAQTHASQVSIKGVFTAGMWNNLVDALINVVSKTTGLLDTTKVVDLSTAQTLLNKILTSPVFTTPKSDTLTANTTNADLTLAGNGTGKVKATSLYGAVTTDTDGATITLDCSPTGGNRHSVVLGGNRIIALSNTSSGQMVVLDLIQDSTGSRTVTHPSTAVAAITMTIATPGVVTLGKDIPTLTPITFTTTGALPTGVTAGTTYYWVRVSSTTGNLATSVANAQAGTLVATSGSQSGVHAAQIQIRWPSNTIPTLSTGKYQLDTINYYIKDATNGIVQGYTSGQTL